MWKFEKHIYAFACLITLMISTGFAQSARQSSTLMSPEASLTAPSVSPLSTNAWSERAIEKTEEWIAYLNLLREAIGDTLIQNQLILFSEAYFLDSESQLIWGEEMLAVRDWLTRQSQYTGPEIHVSESAWEDDWMLEDQEWRRILRIVIETSEEEELAWEGERMMTVVLSRVEKAFGEETIATWEVRFDELR